MTTAATGDTGRDLLLDAPVDTCNDGRERRRRALLADGRHGEELLLDRPVATPVLCMADGNRGDLLLDRPVTTPVLCVADGNIGGASCDFKDSLGTGISIEAKPALRNVPVFRESGFGDIGSPSLSAVEEEEEAIAIAAVEEAEEAIASRICGSPELDC